MGCPLGTLGFLSPILVRPRLDGLDDGQQPVPEVEP